MIYWESVLRNDNQSRVMAQHLPMFWRFPPRSSKTYIQLRHENIPLPSSSSSSMILRWLATHLRLSQQLQHNDENRKWHILLFTLRYCHPWYYVLIKMYLSPTRSYHFLSIRPNFNKFLTVIISWTLNMFLAEDRHTQLDISVTSSQKCCPLTVLLAKFLILPNLQMDKCVLPLTFREVRPILIAQLNAELERMEMSTVEVGEPKNTGEIKPGLMFGNRWKQQMT